VDLVHSAVIKLVGGAIHLRRRTVDFRLVGLLLLGSLPGSLCGIALLAAARARGANLNAIVTKVLGVALVAASLAVLFRVWLREAPRTAAADLGGSGWWRPASSSACSSGSLRWAAEACSSPSSPWRRRCPARASSAPMSSTARC